MGRKSGRSALKPIYAAEAPHVAVRRRCYRCCGAQCQAFRSPKPNGAVERCNGAWRYEFYAGNELPLNLQKLAQRVAACQHLYNHHRPHGALAGLTPAKYLSIRSAEDSPASHICLSEVR